MTRKLDSRFFLCALVLSLTALLGACGQSKGPDAAAGPELLVLLGDQTRTVTGDSVVVVGAVGDANLKSLGYSLNGGEVQDALNALNEKSFRLTVTGLKSGENTVVVTVADKTGATASASLAVEVTSANPNSPKLEGSWSDAAVTTSLCGQTDAVTVTLSFDAPRADGLVVGLWQVVSSGYGGQSAGSFAGTVTAAGKLTGVATLVLGQQPARYNFDFSVSAEKIAGILTSQENLGCDNGQRQSSSLTVTLVPLQDDAFEPNDTPEKATQVGLDFAATLELLGGDADWFTFTLSEAKLMTFALSGSANPYAPLDLRLLDASLSVLFNTSSYDATALQTGLTAGTYYVSVTSGSLAHQSYSLKFTNAALPDASSEPNDTSAQAGKVTLPFSGDFYLTPGDEDWFTFTLNKTQLVTLYLGDNSYNLEYELLKSNLTSVSSGYYYGGAVTRSLGAGSYFLRVRSPFGQTQAYPLALSTAPLPDAEFEPNDTFNTPSKVSLPFSGDFFIDPQDEDWFEFTLGSEQLVTFRTIDQVNLQATLLKSSGADPQDFYLGANGALALLGAGTYRLKLFAGDAFAYSLAITKETSADKALEPNDTRATATPVTLNFAKTKLLTSYQDPDWFTFTLSQGKEVAFDLSTASGNAWGALYKGTDEAYLDNVYPNSPRSYVLTAGTYYLNVYGDVLTKYDLTINAP